MGSGNKVPALCYICKAASHETPSGVLIRLTPRDVDPARWICGSCAENENKKNAARPQE